MVKVNPAYTWRRLRVLSVPKKKKKKPWVAFFPSGRVPFLLASSCGVGARPPQNLLLLSTSPSKEHGKIPSQPCEKFWSFLLLFLFCTRFDSSLRLWDWFFVFFDNGGVFFRSRRCSISIPSWRWCCWLYVPALSSSSSSLLFFSRRLGMFWSFSFFFWLCWMWLIFWFAFRFSCWFILCVELYKLLICLGVSC